MLNHKEKCPADTYAAIWNADIPWTTEKVNQLPTELINTDAADVYSNRQIIARPDGYIISRAAAAAAASDDDNNRYTNPQCTNRELLMVSWPLDRDDVDTAKLLRLYTAWVDKQMSYLPLRVKKFDVSATGNGGSDLLSSISSYYSTDAIVSPALLCRRNLTILREDYRYTLYQAKFKSIQQSFGFAQAK
jgi:hypothetical protein